VIVGHSDKDLRPDNPERKKGETPGQFEMRISGARAARAKEALLAKIRVISRGRSTHQLEQLLNDPKRSRTVGMGATDRLRQNPVNDTERKLNRRVEFHLVTALIPDPDPPCSLDGARQEIPEEDFHRINLAYAITVHKAQGSQFKRVIVPVVKSCLLDRTLIYTALTRGMEQVVFIGDRHAFDAAVTAPPHSHERQVGFSM
jgi:hypothetical protein